jgi:hypothetical protein
MLIAIGILFINVLITHRIVIVLLYRFRVLCDLTLVEEKKTFPIEYVHERRKYLEETTMVKMIIEFWRPTHSFWWEYQRRHHAL